MEKIMSRPLTKQGRENWDRIFRSCGFIDNSNLIIISDGTPEHELEELEKFRKINQHLMK